MALAKLRTCCRCWRVRVARWFVLHHPSHTVPIWYENLVEWQENCRWSMLNTYFLFQIHPCDAFLPIAERYQLSSKIDRWVINAVYDYFVENIDKIKGIDTISINLSGHSLTDNELEKFIIDKLTDSKLPAKNICVLQTIR